MSQSYKNKTESDIQITKEVFRIKYNPPEYIDLTELSDSDTECANITHISETEQESGKNSNNKTVCTTNFTVCSLVTYDKFCNWINCLN